MQWSRMGLAGSQRNALKWQWNQCWDVLLPFTFLIGFFPFGKSLEGGKWSSSPCISPWSVLGLCVELVSLVNETWFFRAMHPSTCIHCRVVCVRVLISSEGEKQKGYHQLLLLVSLGLRMP